MLDRVDTRPQLGHCFRQVLQLRFLVLTSHHYTRGNMRQTDSGVGRVHRLPSRTGRTIGIFPNICRIQHDIHLFCLRQYGHRGRRGMHPSLSLCRRDALHAMYSRLVFHNPVDTISRDVCDDFLVSPGSSFTIIGYFYFPTFGFTEFRIHTEQIPGEKTGLVSPGSGTNFKNHVLRILRIGRNQQHFHLRLQFGDLGTQLLNLHLCHFF